MATEIVIVGGGFAGVAAARELERRARRKDVRVTLVSRTNYLLFTPMLPEVAGGSIDARGITQPLRAALRHTNVELAETREVDLDSRTITVESPLTGQREALHFDHLVLALGSIVSDGGVRGVREHAIYLKTVPDAVALRDRVLGALEVAASTRELVERDRLLRFVVVGGGFTGVETAGELVAFLRAVRRFYPELHDTDAMVELVERDDRLLSSLPEKFGKRAAGALRDRGVVLHMGAKIASVDAGGLQFEDGARMESRTVVWSAGVRPEPLIETLPLRRSQHGALIVNPDFSVPECAGVWAIGDCAAIPNRTRWNVRAHGAERGARRAAARAQHSCVHGQPAHERFRLQTFGPDGVTRRPVWPGGVPGNRMISGRAAWVLWRTYYLGRLPGWYRKARVAADWTLDAIFPPGVSRLALVGDLRSDEEVYAVTR